MFASCKLIFVYVALGVPAGVFGIPYSLAVRNVRWLYRLAAHSIIPWGLRAAGIRVIVSGRELIPAETSCIFLANHTSNLDPPVLYPELPDMTVAMLKRELMRIPLLGHAMRMGGFVPVERGNRREAAQVSVARAAEALRSGRHMLIFPEGTRSADGRLQPFKRGPFYLAMDTGAPVVPIAIVGTHTMLPKGRPAVRPGTASVSFLEPLWPRDFSSREELMAAVRERMIAALPDEMRPE